MPPCGVVFWPLLSAGLRLFAVHPQLFCLLALMKPLLTLALTSALPIVGIAAIGSLPGVADGQHNVTAHNFLLATAPPPVQETRLWVRLISDVSLSTLADDLDLNVDTLVELNEQTDEAILKKGAWVVLPETNQRLIALSSHLNSSEIRDSAPLTAPPTPSDVVRVSTGDSIVSIATDHGLTLAEIRQLNPGLNLAKLVIGSDVRVANAAQGSLLAIRPGVSGGASWPNLPSLPGGLDPARIQSFLWPAKGVFTSGYGWRWGRMHKGIDIANNVGTPIIAAKDGIVAYSGWSSGYGYLVELSHGDGSSTRYAHNSRLLVRKGQIVPQGQTISLMGSTGRSTGPHLHFEIRKAGGAAVDPMAMLPSRRA